MPELGILVPSSPKYTYEGLMAMFNNRQISESEFLEQMERLETTNTDWFDVLTRNSFSHSHNLSISGGGEKVKYYLIGSFPFSKRTDELL